MADLGFTSLKAYTIAESTANRIFQISSNFPREEKYSLTDQVRRSSRSVCANLAEAYAKRDYPKHFHSKLTDCLGENNETLTWLRFSLKCEYISQSEFDALIPRLDDVRKLLNFMMRNPTKFGVRR